nr:hypothetical protein [Tanacetum cinerariifolium]
MHQSWRTFTALINRSLSGKTTGLDKLRLSRAQILWGMYYQKNVDYVALLWEDFIYQINNRAYKKQEKMYYPRLTKVIIHYFLTQDKIVSWRNKIGMHTSKDDYLINTLRFISANEATQIYDAILHESLTSHEIKETKAYPTYLGFATGATPPKKARKFKKHASPQLFTVLFSSEEPIKKSKRVKRSLKKSTKAPAGGVVIRETLEMPLSKKNEKEVRKKSLRDFHKTHPSGSGIVTKIAPSAAKIKPSVTNEGTGVKPGVLDVTEEESSESETESWGNDEDDNNNEQDSRSEISDEENKSDDKNTQSDRDDKEEEEDEFVRTSSNDSNDETKMSDKTEGDKDEEMDYTTSKLYDDVDIQLNELVDVDEGFIQKEGTNDEIINVQRRNDNSKISQVIEDAYVTLFTIPPKTKVPVTSSFHSSDLEAKFLNFVDIPTTYVKIVSSMDVHVHHERSQKDKDKDEDPSAGSDRGLKKTKTSKDTEPLKGSKAKELQSGSYKGDKSQSKSSGKSVQSEEPEFKVADSDMPQDEEENPGPAFRLLKGPRTNCAELKYDFKECCKALSEKLDWENPKGGDYSFDLTKPLPLVMNGNRQMVPVDYFFNNDFKYLQGGILTMTYTTSLTKTKAAQYDLPGIEDMVSNILSPVKWRSRFLRYIDTRPNGDALRKCILNGPYIPTTIVVQAVAATDDSSTVPEHTTVETPMNMSPENKAQFESEKEAFHLILTGIGDEIYSTVDACQTAQKMWEAIERLQQFKMSRQTYFGNSPEWSKFVTIVKQQHKLDEVSYHKLFNILKQYQKEVNELRAERLARNANPLAIIATAQANQDPYYQSSKYKGKEIAKPITSPSESASEEDIDPEQAQRDKDMQTNLAPLQSTSKGSTNLETTTSELPQTQETRINPKRFKDSAYHKEKMLLCKQAEKGVPLQAEQYDWLADMDAKIDEQELEAHYIYMAKIQEVSTADSGTDSEPLE